jgi:hypothetical protein
MMSLKKYTWRLIGSLLLIAGLAIWSALGSNPFTRTIKAAGLAIASLAPSNFEPAREGGLDAARESALKDLYRQIKSGAPSSVEERGVLVRFVNRGEVSELEADTVISRAIYKRYVADQALSKKQKKLLKKYEKLIAKQDRTVADLGLRGPLSPAGGVCNNYSVVSEAGFAISTSATDVGNHCEDCTTEIALPFPYTLYDQTFTSAFVSSNGVLQFSSNGADFTDACLPAASFSYAILPYWDDLCTGTDCGEAGAGSATNAILTSVGGAAPDRFFDIEWRASYSSNPSQTANFRIRLYENQLKFDVVYGQIDQGGESAVVGIQRDGTCLTQFKCHSAGIAPGTRVTFTTTPAACTIGCPSDVTVPNDPGQQGAIVSFSPPATSGDCGTLTCSPASGSVFPLGATTVNCNTTSGSGCSFSVTVEQQTTGYDLCLQDSSATSTVLLFNSNTGDYLFCCGGTSFAGTGKLTVRGSNYTLEHNSTDRRILAKIDYSSKIGSGSIQSPPGTTICTITDKNTSDNTCTCK